MQTDSLFDLTDEIAVVIGGTGALGGALSQALAAAGARTAVAGRNIERGVARVQEISQAGGVAKFFEADTSSRISLDALLNAVEETWGTPSILINAAGGNDPMVTATPENPFEHIATEAWLQSFDLNLVECVLLPCQILVRP